MLEQKYIDYWRDRLAQQAAVSVENKTEAIDLTAYRDTLKQRQATERHNLNQRLIQAWEIARQAANLLKQEFGVHQVAVFGSLVHGRWFSKTSDIDLVVWGCDPDAYFVAVARLQDLSPFKVDLVAMENCSPALRQEVLRESQIL